MHSIALASPLTLFAAGFKGFKKANSPFVAVLPDRAAANTSPLSPKRAA
jgi:hypothetical protein